MNAGDEQRRRENHGWFGTPWWSWVCYDENGQLNTAMRKAFPAGESCGYCEVAFDEAAGDGGTAMPFGHADGNWTLRHVHKECSFRQVAGGLAHHQKRCHCYGGEGEGTPGMSLREEAVAVWALVAKQGEGT
jgi:hypothetical protein